MTPTPNHQRKRPRTIPIHNIPTSKRGPKPYVGINPNSMQLLVVSCTVRLTHVLTTMRRYRNSDQPCLPNSWNPVSLAIDENLSPKYAAFAYPDRTLEIVNCESLEYEWECDLPSTNHELNQLLVNCKLVGKDGIIPFDQPIKFDVQIAEKFLKGTFDD